MTLDMILTMPGKTRRLGAALTALILLSSAGPTAALNVTVNADIAAGQAAWRSAHWLNSAGTCTTTRPSPSSCSAGL